MSSLVDPTIVCYNSPLTRSRLHDHHSTLRNKPLHTPHAGTPYNTQGGLHSPILYIIDIDKGQPCLCPCTLAYRKGTVFGHFYSLSQTSLWLKFGGFTTYPKNSAQKHQKDQITSTLRKYSVGSFFGNDEHVPIEDEASRTQEACP